MGNGINKVTIRTVCGITDYLKCGLSVEVTDGVITKVRPADFPDPIDKGACEKGLKAYQMVYHPDRLRYPLKRTGERGGGKWQRISWDEALDDIVVRLQNLATQYGSTSIAWTAPILSNLAGGGYSRLISLTKGTEVDWWGCGDAAGPCADLATFGSPMGERYIRRIENPKFTIVWGYNPAVTVFPYMRRITRDREKGCKVVVIDPRFTETASHADEHVPIRPGTDGALALGMMHVILEQGLQDERFIAENTVGPLLVRGDNGFFLRESDLEEGGSQQGFMVIDKITNQAQPHNTPGLTPSLTGVYSISGIQCRPAYQLLADLVQQFTPEKVSQITDIPADVIKRLAINYATQKPAAIYRGWGMQRSFYGDLSCRAINTLAAITGNINAKRPSTFVLNAHSFLMPGGPYTTIPLMSLYDAIIKGEPFAIKALWCTWHNFINQMPNTHRVVGELLPNLELLVVCDLFMTESANYADYVLPAASFFECTDLCRTDLQHPYLQLQQKVIEPLWESRSDFQIAAELGRRMGFGEYFTKTEEQYIEEILASGHPTMEGVSVERLKSGPVMAQPSDRPQQFGTPTGRIEFYVESLKQFGQELPVYIEPVESVRSEKARSYPLTLLSTHPNNRVHSTLAIVPGLLGKEPEPTLQINPVDAEPRNIVDGDVVRVFNDRGQLKVEAELSNRIKPGIVNITEGWWPDQYIEGHLNQLTHDMINPVQQYILQPNAAFYDVLVEVEKV